MAKIVGNMDSKVIELDVKRFYLPGVKVEDKCPKCGHAEVCDLNRDYLSYPSINTEEDVYFGCQKCYHEWHVAIVLRLSLGLAE